MVILCEPNKKLHKVVIWSLRRITVYHETKVQQHRLKMSHLRVDANNASDMHTSQSGSPNSTQNRTRFRFHSVGGDDRVSPQSSSQPSSGSTLEQQDNHNLDSSPHVSSPHADPASSRLMMISMGFRRIMRNLQRRIRWRLRLRTAPTAVLLLIVTAGVYLLTQSKLFNTNVHHHRQSALNLDVDMFPTSEDGSKFVLNPAAVCFGRNNVTLSQLKNAFGVKEDDLCVPDAPDLPKGARELGIYLDLVGGICTESMNAMEIRDRALSMFDARSTVPMEIVNSMSFADLLHVGLCTQPWLPNRMPTTERGQWYPNREYPTAASAKELYHRFFRLISLRTISRLNNFEFDIVAKLPFSKMALHDVDLAPSMAKIALLLSGVASPASYRRLYSRKWLEEIDGLYERLDFEVEQSNEEERSIAIAYINSQYQKDHSTSPLVLQEALVLLGSSLPLLSNASIIDACEPLPRSVWRSGIIRNSPRWSGHTPPLRSNSTAPVAIVIPCHDGEVAKIKYFFERWPREPTNATVPDLPVVLALNQAFDDAPGSVMRDAVLSMWAELHLNATLYLLSLKQPAKANHYDGAAMSFYQLQAFLSDYFFAMQLVETDVVPISPRWREQLVHEAVGACSIWWMKGSTQQCSPLLNYRTDLRRDFHINGNSLYSLGCKGFDNYIRRIQAFYPPHGSIGGQCFMMGGCETGKEFEGGYDHVLYRYRVDPQTFHYSRNIVSRFAYTKNLLNYCEEDYNATYLIQKNPNVFLVHSKFHMYSPEERHIYTVYNKILYRQPTSSELTYLWPKLRHRLYTVDEVTNLVCSLEEARNVASQGMESTLCHTRAKAAKSPRTPEKTIYAQAEVDPIDLLGCATPVLRDHHVKIVSSSDEEICRAYGDCPSLRGGMKGAESAFANQEHSLSVMICGQDAKHCRSKLISSIPMIFMLSAEGILKAHLQGDHVTSHAWADDIVRLAEQGTVTIVAMDLFSREYLRYITGLQPVLATAWCGESSYTYNALVNGGHGSEIEPQYLPVRHEVLVWTPDVKYVQQFVSNATEAFGEMSSLSKVLSTSLRIKFSSNLTAIDLSNMYGKGIRDFLVARHPAIVVVPMLMWIPIQVVAYYRQGIPLFVPSSELYQRWHRHNFAQWFPNIQQGASMSLWLDQIMEIAAWPGVTTFDSVEDLAKKLVRCDLKSCSKRSKQHNVEHIGEIKEAWYRVLSPL